MKTKDFEYLDKLVIERSKELNAYISFSMDIDGHGNKGDTKSHIEYAVYVDWHDLTQNKKKHQRERFGSCIEAIKYIEGL